MRVPDGPGLGATLDLDALDRYHRAVVTLGSPSDD